jgi:hypothetical protein
MVCAKDVTKDDPLFLSTIEQLKIRHFGLPKTKVQLQKIFSLSRFCVVCLSADVYTFLLEKLYFCQGSK